jgi:two-component system response regulator HydG
MPAGLALGGTVLLREIQALPMEVQTQLFRLIEGRGEEQLDLRFMATASEPLEPLAASGAFRQDLFYRMSVFVLRMPALRDRIADIPALIDYFLDLDAAGTGRRIRVTDQALRVMMRYPWPGNVRQLRSAIERASNNMVGTHMRQSNLPEEIREWRQEDGVDVSDQVQTLAEAEKSAILAAMKYTRGDKMKAAQLLGIGRTTLYRKLEEYK